MSFLSLEQLPMSEALDRSVRLRKNLTELNPGASGVLVFSHPDSPDQRVAMTIRTSRDGGRTWSAGRLLDPRPSAYSCLSVLKDGRLGILYETGDKHAVETLTFARFPLEYVEGK